MSDGITDASRYDKVAIQNFRQSIRKEVIESFTTNELVEELKKRWKKQSPMTDIIEWCNAKFVLADNDCTFHCNRVKGHEGQHEEHGRDNKYVMVWYDIQP